MHKEPIEKIYFYLLMAIVLVVNGAALFNDILEPDGTLYAGIAKHIAQTNNWMDLWALGAEWLDKPHLPFWLAAISFKLLGISAFAYKLPSFLFFIVSLIYCYRLASLLYSKLVAQLSTLIYGSALHIIISNFDGKVEMYLTAFILGAIYHLYQSEHKKWLGHIIAAALLSACAIMTKGVFALITIVAGFVIYWIKTKQWLQFIQWKWYVFIGLTVLFIVPELYSLYHQFDLHPEKIVFGKTHVSGLKFFIWDSQFGRFFNNGPIRGEGNPLFFVHTSAWAFLPWTLYIVMAILALLRSNKASAHRPERWIIGGAALITFLMFSLSKFQLPHYIVIVFPQLAMLCAHWLAEKASDKSLKRLAGFQTILFILLMVLLVIIGKFYAFDAFYVWAAIFFIISLMVLFYPSANSLLSIIHKGVGFALILGLFLNGLFYPSLLQYQGGMMAAKWLNANPISQPAILYQSESIGFDFYYKGKVTYAKTIAPQLHCMRSQDSLLLCCYINALPKFPADSATIRIVKTFSNYHISQLNAQFLNHRTRNAELGTFALVMVKRKTLLLK